MGKEQMLITLPKRGIKVIPPQETREKMREAKSGQVVHFSDAEKYRLKRLINCAILAKRYPNPQVGREYMNQVDYTWREELLGMAGELTETIVTEWAGINPDQPIAVLLYGSVAKGLVKTPLHPDPSNIDMAAIGVISDEEKFALFDRIRPKREEIQQRILSQTPHIESGEKNPGNAGVIIQNIDKVIKENFAEAKAYITAGAFAMCDEAGLWRGIEQAAIQSAFSLNGKGSH